MKTDSLRLASLLSLLLLISCGANASANNPSPTISSTPSAALSTPADPTGASSTTTAGNTPTTGAAHNTPADPTGASSPTTAVSTPTTSTTSTPDSPPDVSGNGYDIVIGAPFVDAKPPVSFGEIRVGETAPPRTLTVRNNDGNAYHIIDLTFTTGDMFTVSEADHCTGITLKSKQTCAFDVVFGATTDGNHTVTPGVKEDTLDVQGKSLGGGGTIPTPRVSVEGRIHSQRSSDSTSSPDPTSESSGPTFDSPGPTSESADPTSESPAPSFSEK